MVRKMWRDNFAVEKIFDTLLTSFKTEKKYVYAHLIKSLIYNFQK